MTADIDRGLSTPAMQESAYSPNARHASARGARPNARALASALTRAVLEPVGEYRAMSRAGLALVADRRAQLGLAAR